MKSKRRHQSSSDESEDTEGSVLSSSSDSESEDSSDSEHRHRKKKKRAVSSESDSDSDHHRRSKKRKHKKKKKKHDKRKRRSDSATYTDSEADDHSSISEGEISPKKKQVKHTERRLHSVVKERRRSSEEVQPVRTYYNQKEYHSNSPANDFERQREHEVQRFYRGSSKERRIQEQYHYDNRGHNERYSRYDGHRPPPHPEEEYHRRPREEPYPSRGFNRPNFYEERGPKRNFDEGRDFRERDRRGPPEPDKFREREFPERRERYREEPFHPDRGRDAGRDKPRGPPPPPSGHRNSEEERFRERGRRPEPRDERPPREVREVREPRDVREVQEPRDVREVREPREIREVREPRDTREVREARELREPRDSREVREPRDAREVREPRDVRENKEPRDTRQAREPRDEREDREPQDERAERPRPRRPPPRQDKPDNRRDKKSRFADAEGDKEYSWGKTEVKKEGTKDGEKEKPNFGLSGKLTADANTVNGVVIKYTEPDDAKQPKRRWRFYPFKGDKALPILYIHRQSAFLIGRDKKVADIPLEHPSISKQHAALQYRATPFIRPDGSTGRRVRPYIIDLESANGTFVNNKKIEPRRYVELLEKDVVKFGFSLREYVLLHENSKDEAQDDDNQEPVPVVTTDHIKHEKRIKQEVAEDGD